jgi:hypothetical protein
MLVELKQTAFKSAPSWLNNSSRSQMQPENEYLDFIRAYAEEKPEATHEGVLIAIDGLFCKDVLEYMDEIYFAQ